MEAIPAPRGDWHWHANCGRLQRLATWWDSTTHPKGVYRCRFRMSANVDVECRQGSLQMVMEMWKIYDKKCQKWQKMSTSSTRRWCPRQKCQEMTKNVTVKHPKMMPKTKEFKKWQKMSMSIQKTCKCRTYVDVDGFSRCRPDMVDICTHP